MKMKSIISVCVFMVAFVNADVTFPALPDDGSCELGKSYQDGCNVCNCFGEKALLCKKQEGCLNKDEKEGHVEDICKEGDVKYGPLGKCNVCICLRGQGGIIDWSCNDENCPVNRRKRDVGTITDLKYTPCAPNDSFVLDCNTCYCNSAKSGYRCSEHICDPDNSSEILIAQNGTKINAFNVSSTLFNATVVPLDNSTASSVQILYENGSFATNNVTVIPSIPTLGSEFNSSAPVNYSVTPQNGTTVLFASSTTPKYVINSTTENSVLSVG